MQSPIRKRSINLAGHKTSISVENEFWDCMKEIAHFRGLSVSDFVNQVAVDRPHGNLSSAVRLCVLDYYQSLASMAESGN